MTLNLNLPPEALEALEAASAALGCSPAILAAVLDVESGGFSEAARLAARRFEPHVFRRLGGGSAASHAGAFRLAPELAERASSHGAPQIMGFHAELLGYASATAMRKAFLEGGWPEQIDAMRRYAEATGLASALRSLSIPEISRIYNGPAYAKLGYHLKLSAAYARLSGGSAARVLRLGDRGAAVERLQRALSAAGFAAAPDSAFGPETEAALKGFQQARGLNPDGVAGALTWAALELAAAPEAVEPPPTRAEITVDRMFRHRGKIGALLTALAALRAEAAAFAASLNLDFSGISQRLRAALSDLTLEQGLLLILAASILWPRLGSPALRFARRIF